MKTETTIDRTDIQSAPVFKTLLGASLGYIGGILLNHFLYPTTSIIILIGVLLIAFALTLGYLKYTSLGGIIAAISLGLLIFSQNNDYFIISTDIPIKKKAVIKGEIIQVYKITDKYTRALIKGDIHSKHFQTVKNTKLVLTI